MGNQQLNQFAKLNYAKKNLTQHAKINLKCNKLMQPSKLILKHETNIKTTFKIMNAYAKLKMTQHEIDHLGPGLLFSP